MNNTFPTEGNLSGLSREDFQKEINDKKTDLFILKNTKGMEVAVTCLLYTSPSPRDTR